MCINSCGLPTQVEAASSASHPLLTFHAARAQSTAAAHVGYDPPRITEALPIAGNWAGAKPAYRASALAQPVLMDASGVDDGLILIRVFGFAE